MASWYSLVLKGDFGVCGGRGCAQGSAGSIVSGVQVYRQWGKG